MKIKFKLASLLLLSISGLVSTSFAAESKMSTTFASASATAGASAKVLFQKYCSICHGDNGNGKTRVVKSMIPPPRDFTSAQAAQELTRKRMIDSVTDGRPGTAMVSHTRKLSTDEIASVVDYIRDNFMKFPQVSEQVAANNEVIADNKQSANSEQSANSKESAKGGNNSAGNVLTVDVKGNELGRDIFKKNCSSCHGDRGNTAVWARSGLDPAPRDFTAPHARVELSYQRMIDSVTNGRPGTAMMPFTTRLSTADIEAVVTYIRTAFMQIADNDTARNGGGNVGGSNVASTGKDAMKQQIAPEKEQSKSATVSAGMPDQHAEVDMSAVMPSGLSGDFSKGEDFFLNNCYVCHGKKGDGKGPRSHFITPRPRNFTSDASRQVFNRPRLFDSIQKGKKGTVMPAWDKVLNDQQIADVAEFVFKTYIQIDSDAKESPKDVGEDVSGDAGVEKSSKLNSIPDSISSSKLNGVSEGSDIVKSDEKSEKKSVDNKIDNNAANKEEKKKATEAKTVVSPAK